MRLRREGIEDEVSAIILGLRSMDWRHSHHPPLHLGTSLIILRKNKHMYRQKASEKGFLNARSHISIHRRNKCPRDNPVTLIAIKLLILF